MINKCIKEWKNYINLCGGGKNIYRVTSVTPEEIRNICEYIYTNLDKNNYTLKMIGPKSSPHSFVIIINEVETAGKFITYKDRSDFKGTILHYSRNDYKKHFPNEQLFSNEQLIND